mgnify:CR=1 FL=1
MFQIHQFPCLNDNYGFLAHDTASGETAAIDTPDADKYLAEATTKGWTISQIWNTHWHPDHAGGNLAIKAATNCTITAFVGDAVFALGCGRVFEGNPGMMWDSLSRLKHLPPETALYCAHEYTASNAKFAVTVDPGNAALADYVDEITAKRARNEWTVPSKLSRELATNPFLRADDPALQAAMGHPGDAVATFAEIRGRKDRF